MLISGAKSKNAHCQLQETQVLEAQDLSPVRQPSACAHIIYLSLQCPVGMRAWGTGTNTLVLWIVLWL